MTEVPWPSGSQRVGLRSSLPPLLYEMEDLRGVAEQAALREVDQWMQERHCMWLDSPVARWGLEQVEPEDSEPYELWVYWIEGVAVPMEGCTPG